MGCNKDCGKKDMCDGADDKCYAIFSYTDKVEYSEFDRDGETVREGIFNEVTDVIFNDSVIYDVSKIALINSSLYMYGEKSDDIPLFKTLLRDKRCVRVDETDDIILIALTHSELDSSEHYPLYDINLKDRLDDDGNKSYICEIETAIIPGVPYRKIYELEGNCSEQLLFNAKAITYELQSLANPLKDIELGNINYLINSNKLYRILENGFSGLRLQDVEDEEQVYVLQYPLISRNRDLYLLRKNDIYFDGVNMYKDNGRDIVYTKFDMYEIIKLVNKFLILSTEYDKEDFNLDDFLKLYRDVKLELSDIGALNDTNVVLLNSINSQVWNSISIDSIKNIKQTILSIPDKCE